MRIYTSDNCPYCQILKDKLDKLEIEYVEVDTDSEEHKVEVSQIFGMVGESIIPIIAIKPKLLVPKKSFNTIDEAVILIQQLMEK